MNGYLYDKTVMRDPLFAGVGERQAGYGRSILNADDTLHLLVPTSAHSKSREIAALFDDFRVHKGTDPERVHVHTFDVDIETSERWRARDPR